MKVELVPDVGKGLRFLIPGHSLAALELTGLLDLFLEAVHSCVGLRLFSAKVVDLVLARRAGLFFLRQRT